MADLSFFENLNDLEKYLLEGAVVTYLSNPVAWNEAMKTIAGGASKFTAGATGAGTNIISIGDAYASVGEMIATGTEGGIKSAPVIHSITTGAGGGATITELATGSEVAGVTAGVSAASVFAGIIGGLGLGVASYELFPEFWIGLWNSTFDTDLSIENAEPFIRSKIRTVISAHRNGKATTYIPAEYIQRAYNFIASHTTRYVIKEGFSNITFDGLTGLATSSNRFDRAVVKELNFVSLDLMEAFMTDCSNRLIELGFNCPPIDVKDLYESMQNVWDLSRGGYVRLTFRPYIEAWEKDFKNVGSTTFTVFGVEVFNFGFDTVDVNAKSYGENYRCVRPQSTGGNFDFTTPLYSASKTIRTQTPAEAEPLITIDLKEGQHATFIGSSYWGERGDDKYVYIGKAWEGLYPNTDYSIVDPEELRVDTTIVFFTGNFEPNIRPEVDFDDYVDGALIANGVTPDPAKTPQELYYDWLHEHGLEIAQPNELGENAIITYVPLTVPMELPDPNTVIEHGVNYEPDPASVVLPQPATQTGIVPAGISPEALNQAIQNGIQAYNNSMVTPETFPEAVPDPAKNPQYPQNPTSNPTGDTGFIPDPPDIVGGTATGLISIYNPSKSELSAFASWLWSDDFLDNFIKIFANPMDAIIGLHILYAKPITSGVREIQVGYLTATGVYASVVSQQYSEIDCGTVNVPEFFGNATDYDPYTQIHCYLPFIGIVPLKANDIIGKQLNITYGIDALTGTCLAMLTTYKNGSKITVYTFTGNCAVQLPISGGNYANVIRGLTGFIATGIGAVVTANPLMALGAGASLLSSNVSVQHSGSIGSNAGAMGIRKPYLIISRKTSYDAVNYNQYYGFPANKSVVLGNCKGYTRVKEVHVDNIGIATDGEKREIEALLKSGVIIN